jgi:predicted TIM-barrel fold metal-dependent hydrolase
VALQTIDVDQHLFETPTAWADHIDPKSRPDALSIEDDERRWAWLTWRGAPLYVAELQRPRHPEEVGENRLKMGRGEAAPGRYADLLPASYCGGTERLAALDRFGLDATVLFPNFGLIWEGMLAGDPVARRANMRAYNRFMVEATAAGRGRLFGVAHVSLDDPGWLADELTRLSAEGIRLAMVAPAPVDGKPLSHRDLDPAWAAFCDTGIAPVFHVSGYESPINAAWHADDPEPGDRLLDSVFLWMAPAIALANMIVHGTFQRFPELRVGVVELTAGWVPGFLLNLDGAFDFYAARHGGPFRTLGLRPSEYFYRQVRVAALPYELPSYLVSKVGEDTFMIGSDWPHAEGVADPGGDRARSVESLGQRAQEQALGGNAAWLLGL